MMLMSVVHGIDCGEKDSFTITSDKFKGANGCYRSAENPKTQYDSIFVSLSMNETRAAVNYVTPDSMDELRYNLMFREGEDRVACTEDTDDPIFSPIGIPYWTSCKIASRVVYVTENDFKLSCGCQLEEDSETGEQVVDDDQDLGGRGTLIEELTKTFKPTLKFTVVYFSVVSGLICLYGRVMFNKHQGKRG